MPNPFQSSETNVTRVKTQRASLWRPNVILLSAPFVAILVYQLFLPTAIHWAYLEYRKAVSRGLKTTEDELMLQLEMDLVTAYTAVPYIIAVIATGAMLSVASRRKGIKRYAAGFAIATVPLIGGLVFILCYTFSAR